MKSLGNGLLAWALAALILACPAAAQTSIAVSDASSGVMQLEAGYLEYDREKKIAVLKENAHVEYDDLKLWADNIHEDFGRDQVYAQGRIELWRGRERFTGETLSYNYKTRRGALTKLATKRGVSNVEASRIELEPERVIGYDVATTTCDHEPPHYEIKAKKMTLLPGDRVILDRARFIVGGSTWFKLPRYVINLRRGEGVNRFFLKPGYSAVKGFNLKTAYQFYVNDDLYGKLYYNPSQFDGTDLGTHLNYRLDRQQYGEFDFARHESNLIQQQADRYQIGHRVETPWANGNINLLLTDTTFGPLGTDSELNLGAFVTRQFPGWNTQLAMERRFDLDGSSYTFDQIQFLNTLPRFNFSQTGATDLWGTGIGLSIDGNVGKYREETTASTFGPTGLTTGRRTVEEGRGELNFNVSLPPLKVGDVQQINASIRQTEDLYENGEMRHFFSFQANTFEQYGHSFNSAFNYVFQDTGGAPSPFVSFDTLPPRTNLLTGFLRFGNYDRFTATILQATRDFVTDTYTGLSSNFLYHTPIGGQRFLSLGLTPFYDVSRDPTSLGSLRLGSVSTNFRIASGDTWSHALIMNYDAILDRMQSIANRSGFLLNDRTRLDLDSNLSRNTLGTGYDLTKLNLGITRDFHDFEGRIRWNAIQEEIFVEFYLKYASTKRLGLGVNYGDTPDLVPTFGPTGAGAVIP